MAPHSVHPRRRLSGVMVVFGWNGTIVVDADRMRAALDVVLTARGHRRLGEAEFAARFRLPLSRVLVDLGLSDAEAALAEAEWSEELAVTQAHLREGAADALAALSGAGCWLGVVSTASPAAIRYDQRVLQVPSVFHSVTPSVIDRYESLLSLRPHRAEAVFVGDTTDEMRSASAAGFAAVGLAADEAVAEELRHAGAASVIADLSELVPLVEKLAVVTA